MLNLQDKTVAKETGLAVLKAALALFPVGIAINQYMELRSKIKQERLNSFISLLFESLTGKSIEGISNLDAEEFDDLLDSIFRRVIQTKSINKHKRFRDILLNFIDKRNMKFDDAELFLGLVSDLTEPAILILNNYRIFSVELLQRKTRLLELERELSTLNAKLIKESTIKEKGFANKFDSLSEQHFKAEQEIEQLKVEVNRLNAVNMASTYGLDDGEFMYLKQTLFSKGLLVDNFAGGLVGSKSTFEDMTITAFGLKFIDFLVRE